LSLTDLAPIKLKTSYDAVNRATVVEIQIVRGSLATAAAIRGHLRRRCRTLGLGQRLLFLSFVRAPPTDAYCPAKATTSEIIPSRAITALPKSVSQHRLSANTAIGNEEFAKNIASLRASIVM
jgi:hypothetical protein